jgi:hypothetical protein
MANPSPSVVEPPVPTNPRLSSSAKPSLIEAMCGLPSADPRELLAVGQVHYTR